MDVHPLARVGEDDPARVDDERARIAYIALARLGVVLGTATGEHHREAEKRSWFHGIVAG
jgi:hypothetical protein